MGVQVSWMRRGARFARHGSPCVDLQYLSDAINRCHPIFATIMFTLPDGVLHHLQRRYVTVDGRCRGPDLHAGVSNTSNP